MRDLSRLRALRRGELRLLATACAATPLVVCGLALAGFRRTHAAMAAWPTVKIARFPNAAAAAERARSVARITGIATGRGPVRATCLRRSLLVWWLLRREGIETVLRVGVSRDGGSFHAHAWVELLGRPLGDDEDIALRFPAFDRDFAAPGEELT